MRFEDAKHLVLYAILPVVDLSSDGAVLWGFVSKPGLGLTWPVAAGLILTLNAVVMAVALRFAVRMIVEDAARQCARSTLRSVADTYISIIQAHPHYKHNSN
jgi:ABC-type amino acid transport system permease subunit